MAISFSPSGDYFWKMQSIDYSTYRPSVLSEAELAKASWQLAHHYGKAGEDGFQRWTAPGCRVDIYYKPDQSIHDVNIQAEVAQLEEGVYSKIRSLVPALIMEWQNSSARYKLMQIADNRNQGTISQYWQHGDSRLEARLSADGHAEDYVHRFKKDGIDYTEILDEKGRRRYLSWIDGDECFYVEKYFADGRMQSREIMYDHIRIDKWFHHDENGNYEEHDFEEVPIHTIGFRKAKQIVEDTYGASKRRFRLVWEALNEEDETVGRIEASTGHLLSPEKQPATSIPLNYVPTVSFDKYLSQLAGAEKLWVMDGECICGVDTYLQLFEQLKSIAGETCPLETLTPVSTDASWTFTALADGHSHTFSVQHDRDWFDPTFLFELNRLLQQTGSAYSFFSVYDFTWGQETGIIYLHEAVAQSVVALMSYLPVGECWGELNNGIGIHAKSVTE